MRQVARAHAIHPNVARHHLDRLVAAGHVVTATAKHGVGRPAKTYAAVEGALPAGGTSRRDEAAGRAARALRRAARPRARRGDGTRGRRGVRHAARGRARDERRRAVDPYGDDRSRRRLHVARLRRTDRGDAGTLSVVASACPFGEAAAHHPVLCAVDRGLVVGMLGGLGALGAPVTMSSRARGDDDAARPPEMARAFLDCASAAPIRPEVVDAVATWLALPRPSPAAARRGAHRAQGDRVGPRRGRPSRPRDAAPDRLHVVRSPSP